MPWQSPTLSFTKGDVVSVVATDGDSADVRCEVRVDAARRAVKASRAAVECGDET